VSSHANGKNIHRPVESRYIHCDSSGCGCGVVLNGRVESQGFLGLHDEHPHITWKGLKAVRLAILSFLPQLLLHEDNRAVCYILAGLTSRSPEMMNELRRLWYVLVLALASRCIVLMYKVAICHSST
jgi:hypothetical protein